MSADWLSIILLLGWLVLVASALRARRLNASSMVIYALIWGAIFLAVAAIFTALG
jgi:hypothetical protein